MTPPSGLQSPELEMNAVDLDCVLVEPVVQNLEELRRVVIHEVELVLPEVFCLGAGMDPLTPLHLCPSHRMRPPRELWRALGVTFWKWVFWICVIHVVWLV